MTLFTELRPFLIVSNESGSALPAFSSVFESFRLAGGNLGNLSPYYSPRIRLIADSSRQNNGNDVFTLTSPISVLKQLV